MDRIAIPLKPARDVFPNALPVGAHGERTNEQTERLSVRPEGRGTRDVGMQTEAAILQGDR